MKLKESFIRSWWYDKRIKVDILKKGIRVNYSKLEKIHKFKLYFFVLLYTMHSGQKNLLPIYIFHIKQLMDIP